MEWTTLLAGGVFGAVSSWAITWFFHRKAMREQELLREKDQVAIDREREAQRQQSEYERSRSALYRVRESAYNDYRVSEAPPWDAQVNADGTIGLTNLGGDIDQFAEFYVEGNGTGTQSFMRLNRIEHGERIVVSLPGGLHEVDGIRVMAFRGSSYPDSVVVPLHPKHTMYDFRDPRT